MARSFFRKLLTYLSSDDELDAVINAEADERLFRDYFSENLGFPGMLGSIDCMHWKWKNYPAAWKWRAPPVNFIINGNDYTMGYYLADSIYPKWSTFVKMIPSPQGNKKKNFATAQESARKDVECAFGVLQQRFAIVRGPSRLFKVNDLTNIMKACVILHNMIIKDERDDSQGLNMEYDQLDDDLPELSLNPTNEFINFIQRHHEIRDSSAHHQLQANLIEHHWQLYSQQ
ncbi:hypothetical protein F2P56_013176 [Juglans regia]|uniref:Protein ALP1-like n=1 Tax=Juglans regia TaxID=51240 RepID=A0A833XJX6_JUGRE|nr:hypothetical protein F2P56_013176 [Juglans regia]